MSLSIKQITGESRGMTMDEFFIIRELSEHIGLCGIRDKITDVEITINPQGTSAAVLIYIEKDAR